MSNIVWRLYQRVNCIDLVRILKFMSPSQTCKFYSLICENSGIIPGWLTALYGEKENLRDGTEYVFVGGALIYTNQLLGKKGSSALQLENPGAERTQIGWRSERQEQNPSRRFQKYPFRRGCVFIPIFDNDFHLRCEVSYCHWTTSDTLINS